MTPLSNIETELLRVVLDTAAHDVGSMSSALALYADVLRRDPVRANPAAIASLADELRTLGRQLREMRGPSGEGLLAPTRAGVLSGVHERLMRFGKSLLGRGTSLGGTAAEGRVSDADAHALTFVGLALLRHAREAASPTPRVVSLDIVSQDDVAVVTLSMSARGAAVDLAAYDTPWWQWAGEHSASRSLELAMRSDGAIQCKAPIERT